MTTTNQDACRKLHSCINDPKPPDISQERWDILMKPAREHFERDMVQAVRADKWIDDEPQRIKERAETEKKEAERARSENSRRAFLGCKIPARHMETKPDTSGAWGTITAKIISDWQADGGLMIALIGPRGTGKTQAAAQLLKAACKEGIVCRYCKAMDIFLAIKATFSAKDGNESTAMREFTTPKILVIDEMQVRSESEWENNLLTHIVDERYFNKLSTIIISNLAHDAFRKNVGESIYSRFTEAGGIVTMDGINFRAR